MTSKGYIKVAGCLPEPHLSGLATYLRFLADKSIKKLEILPSKSGLPTLAYCRDSGRFFFHSRHDPEREAEQFIKGQGIAPGDRVVIYGLGLGYHLRVGLEQIGPSGSLAALESNLGVAYFAWEVGVLRDLLRAPNFTLYLAISPSGLRTALLEALEPPERKFVIHGPSLHLLPAEFETLRTLLKEWKVRADSINGLQPLMKQNLAANREICASALGVERLFGNFRGVPLFLLAAGPSLSNALPHLKMAAERALLFAVGTALKPLLAHGIVPHLAIITDPSPAVARQVEGIDASFPLIFLPTASKEAVASYKGPKLAAFQAGHSGVEELARRLGHPLIETGGSVATAALDIAIRMGANPIVFVGQDLAYVDGFSHADGTVHGEFIGPVRIFAKAPGNGGGEVITSASWNAYRRWIERRIEGEKERIDFINTSLEGARIAGTRVWPLGKVIERFCRERLPLRETIYSLLA